MKWILIIIALLAGIAIPLLAQVRQFYYLLIVISLGLLAFAILRREITVSTLLSLFIILIPFHEFRIGSKTAFLRLTELAFIPLFVLWISELILKGTLRQKIIFREYLLLILFILLSCLSIFKALYPAISLYRTAVLSYLVVFSFITADIIATKEKLWAVLRTLFIVANTASIWGIFESFIPQMSLFYYVPYASTHIGPIKIYRASCGWDNPNYFALFLLLITPIILTLLMSGMFDRHKRFLRISLILQLLGLVSTFSRNSFLSLVGSALFILWFYRHRRLVILSITTLILILSLIWTQKDYLYNNLPFVYDFSIRTAPSALEAYPQQILAFRWDAWRANINMFKANPWLGVGPFMAGANYSLYHPADALWNEAWGYLEPHNEYLSMLSERGIFAFLLFVVFLFLIMRRGIQLFRRNPDTELGVLAFAVTAGIFSFILAGFGEATLTSVTFWLVLGLLLSVSKLLHQQTPPT